MIKNKITFEIKKEERVYNFFCEVDSPLGEIFDVICQMKAEIVSRINAVNDQPKPEEKKDG